MHPYSKLKAQSAIEYLMTYGWMLLVVAIVGGAIFSMVGDQNIESVSGFDSQELNVQDFGVSLENGLMFSMSDPVGRTEVKEITVSSHESANITYVVNQEVSEENVVNLPGITPSDDGKNLEVDIKYDSGNLENLMASGTVTGMLELDESFDDRTIITEGLIGYWPLSEKYSDGDIVYDLMRNNNHGIMINNPVFTEGITSETSVGFDNTSPADYVDPSWDAPIHQKEGYTVSVWYRPDELTGWVYGQSHFRFTSRVGGSGEVQAHTRVDEDDGVSTGWSDSGFISTEQPHLITTRSWVDADGVTLEVWVDNELAISTTEEADEYFDLSGDFFIGTRDGSQEQQNDAQVVGVLDDFMFYNRALSEEEIGLLYESGGVK